MQKVLTIVGIVFIISIFLELHVYARHNQVSVVIDGEQVIFEGQRPLLVNGRTLVPVRGVFEELGFFVDWNGEVQQVTLTNDKYTIVLTIGSTLFFNNNSTFNLDVPAQIIDGSTMLPLRIILESVGYSLDWDEPNQTVTITSSTQFELPYTSDSSVNSWKHPHIATQSQIFIPSDRRFSDTELETWINEYWFMGGMSDIERDVANLANIERANEDLQPMVIDESLSMATRFHAQMVANNDFYMNLPLERIVEVHDFGPYGGSMVMPRLLFGVIGTNGGAGPVTNMRATPIIQVQTLIQSDSHRRQLMNPNSTRIGVGAQLSVNEERVYFYMIYAR